MRTANRRKPWRGFPSINAVHGIRGYFRQDAPAAVGDGLTPVIHDALPNLKPIHLGTIPGGSIIIGVDVDIPVAFNGAAPAINVGTEADPAALAATGVILPGAAGFKPNLAGGTLLGHVDEDTELFITLTGGTDVTAGQIDVLVRFYINKD